MNTYFTKCGRTFEKSTKAETTGYHIAEYPSGLIKEHECNNCPFVIDVKEGYPEQHHKRWECRAGSLPPNHVTEWRGNLNDKNTLNIYSLDVKFMTEIIAYAQSHPDLSAAYNADSQADCRRTISVSCSGNKKGMAAKKELIDKFFPADVGLDTEEDTPGEEICDNCGYYKSATADVGNCTLKKIAVSRVRPACDDCGPGEVDDEEELSALDLEDQMNTLLESGDKADRAAKENELRCGSCSMGHWYSYKHTYVSVVQSDGMTTIQSPCEPETHYCNNFVEGRKKIASDTDFDPEEAPDWCPRRPKEQELFQEPETSVSETEESVIETAEIVSEQAESVPDVVKPVEVEQAPAFDYSEIDADTATELQHISRNISRIRLNAVHDIGYQLEMAHRKLASHKTGTFGAWCESIGFSRRTAERYIAGYKFICDNFRNIEDASDIQVTLLLEAAKPSAPPELAQAVIDGDITKHKDYVKALENLKEAEKRVELAEQSRKMEYDMRMANWNKEVEIGKKLGKAERELADKGAHIQELQQQVDQLKQSSDPQKLVELESELADLREQLSAKPIEAPAVEIKEVVPESLEIAWAANLQMAIYQLAELTDDEIVRLVKRLGLNNYAVLKDSVRMNSHRAKSRLEKLADTIFAAPVPADAFIKWAKEEPTDEV